MKELPKTIKVEMEDSDVLRGKARNSQHCPIAKAIKRVVGRKYSVNVLGEEGVTIGDKNYSIPKKALNFIERYDEGCWMTQRERSAYNKAIKPISFVARQVA